MSRPVAAVRAGDRGRHDRSASHRPGSRAPPRPSTRRGSPSRSGAAGARRSGACSSATSSAGSNRTTRASTGSPSTVETAHGTIAARRRRRGRWSRRSQSATTTPLPDGASPQTPARTRTVLASAELGDLPRGRVGRAGRPAVAAAARSRRRHRAGRSRRAARRARRRSRSGGGRTALSVRIAVDVWAASVSRGTGPIASRPPASHTTSRAWAAPVRLPATRSAAPRNPLPSDRAAVRPMAEPIDSPMPTAISSAGEDDVRPDVDGDRVEWLDQDGRARGPTSAPPPTAPSRPPTCGSAPELKPRTTASTTSRMATRSSGFTARSSHRGHESAPAPVAVRGGPGWSRAGVWPDVQPTVTPRGSRRRRSR